MFKYLATTLCLLIPSIAAADWDHQQRSGYARATTVSGQYELWLSCRRGDTSLELTVADRTLGGGIFQGANAAMLWVTLPDGRTDRQSVDIAQEGPSASGRYFVSDFTLDIFRNAQSYSLDIMRNGQWQELMKGNMRGSGAARLAFLEQCGL